MALKANGRLSADKIVVRSVVASKVSSTVQVQDGKIEFKDLRADLLGGRHAGDWKVDFTSQPPRYTFSGVLDRVTLGQVAASVTTSWITGTATAKYQVDASGLAPDELLASATGTSQVELINGAFPHIMLAENAGLRVQHLIARLALRAGRVEIQDGHLETAGDEYQLSGMASLDRVLNLKLTRDAAPGFSITGTLAQPRVTPLAAANAQAELRR
jgi:uncharacterized protein involved in outer membrane biogenesis